MKLAFNVLHDTWTADGQEFPAGENVVEDATPELVKLAGSAHAAGAIEVSEGLDLSHVQPEEENEAKLAEAMGEWVPSTYGEDGRPVPGYWSGGWQEGHELQAKLDDARNEVAAAKAEDDADRLAAAQEAEAAVEAEIGALAE